LRTAFSYVVKSSLPHNVSTAHTTPSELTFGTPYHIITLLWSSSSCLPNLQHSLGARNLAFPTRSTPLELAILPAQLTTLLWSSQSCLLNSSHSFGAQNLACPTYNTPLELAILLSNLQHFFGARNRAFSTHHTPLELAIYM
jgi:hypothetical protein